jgi:hypothetical protein
VKKKRKGNDKNLTLPHQIRDVVLQFADPAVLWAESISLARTDRRVVGDLVSKGASSTRAARVKSQDPVERLLVAVGDY